MSWIVPAILASLLWGVGFVLIKKSLSELSPFVTNMIGAVFDLLLWIPFSLYFGIRWDFFLMAVCLAFFASLPNFVFPYIISKSDVSLSGTVLAAYPAVTVLLSLIFLKESLDFLQLLGIAAIIIGIFFIAKPEHKKLKIAGWIWWAVFAAAVIGLGDFISKVAINNFGLYTFTFSLALCSLSSLAVIRIFDKEPVRFGKWNKHLYYNILGNFFLPLGLLFLYLALSRGPASLVSPVTSTYPMITVILAFIYLREKINRRQAIGILITILGVVMTGI